MIKLFLETGKITGTHGVRGEMRVHPWCDSPEFLTDFKRLYLDDKGEQHIKIVRSRAHGNIVIIKVDGVELNALWARRQATKFNGVSYITQRAAEAVYSEEGKKQVREIIAYYQNNSKIIYNGLKECGFTVYGAVNSPYVWLKTPDGMSSWEFFDTLLENIQVVGTPGEGFGPSGEGYFRLTAFGSTENTIKAVERIKNYFAK